MVAGLAASGFAAPLSAQGLQRRAAAVRDGAVGFRYAAAPGVYGTDDGVIIVRRNGHTSIMHGDVRGDVSGLRTADLDAAGCLCKAGPVRVVLVKRGGAVSRLETVVGDRWPAVSDSVRDLGEVAPQDAADFLLVLVPDAPRRVTDDAIVAATLGRDVVLWRDLLPLARDRSLATGKRKQVVFWLGQEASDAVLGPLRDLVLADDDDIAVRKSAIFALSQHEGSKAVPTLMRLAGSDKLDPRLRKQAFFWLAQHDDPEVVDFFEKLLTGGRR
ncbi:MAG TPA: HEAT repeat domain-containing protein [Longimicrobiales bacterium]|nr:HEAT repeat domain-containing protein [Longimicrobiales bacterium]